MVIQVREDESLGSRWRSKWMWREFRKIESTGSGDWGWMGKNLGWPPLPSGLGNLHLNVKCDLTLIE